MARLSVFNTALEDILETEKLLQISEASASGGSFGSLKESVASNISRMQKDRDNPVESSGSSSSSSDTSSDDSSDSEVSEDTDDGMGSDMDFDMDEGEEEPGEESEESEDDKDSDNKDDNKDTEDKDDKKDDNESDKEATESASLYPVITLESLERDLLLEASEALEDSFDLDDRYVKRSVIGTAWRGAKNLAGTALTLFTVAAAAFGYIGVNIGLPIFKRLYKAFVYLGAKFIRYSYTVVKKLEKEVDDFTTRTSKLKEDISEAKEVIKLLEQKNQEFKDSVPSEINTTFNRVAVINMLKVGELTNSPEVTDIVINFINTWYTKTNKDIEKDSAIIKQILRYGVDAKVNPVRDFGDSSMRVGLKPNTVVSSDGLSEFVTPMCYAEVLPGDMIYCCNAPNGKATTLEGIRQAYSDSSCFFTLNTTGFVKIEQLPYMDLAGVSAALDKLSILVEALDKQKEIYNTIKSEKTSYLQGFKRYVYSIAESNEKISLERSMLEYVYIRGKFIDNVYLLTAQDIHLYTQKYISNALIYLRANLEQLSK